MFTKSILILFLVLISSFPGFGAQYWPTLVWKKSSPQSLDFDPKSIAHKKLEDLSESAVYESFDRKDLKVFTDSAVYCDAIREEINAKTVVLLMSSGNFGGVVVEDFAKSL